MVFKNKKDTICCVYKAIKTTFYQKKVVRYITIYKVKENGITVEKSDTLSNMSFIDTGLKFYGLKVYEGIMFNDDSKYTQFMGYYYKDDVKQLVISRNAKKLERNVGKSFKTFSCKPSRMSWSEWFVSMSKYSIK